MTDMSRVTSNISSELELLERHILMLRITRENQPIGIIRLSELLGMPKHKVRYSLRILESVGLIEATASGAVVTGRYRDFMAYVSEYLEELMERMRSMKDAVP
jgi:predicted transcriptional regulator